MDSLFSCPNCGQNLTRNDHTYTCPSGHSFDIAKEGYTYLLPPNQKHSASPGDDKGMASARRAFLSKDYYAPLRDALKREITKRAPDQAVLLDTGCGEGYYTDGVFRSLQEQEKHPRACGIDISKPILRYAAKRNKEIEFAVASSYRLPVPSNSVDLLLNCFSPLALEEFLRVLKNGGYYFYVVPARKHLWELKCVLYDTPYENEEKETPYEGFSYDAIVPVDAQIHLTSPEDIQALFQMTPYYWKTSKEGSDRLKDLMELTTTISFRIHIFKKDGSPE